MFFTPAELAVARAESAAAMPDTFRVVTSGTVVTTDSGGEYTTGPGTEDFPCRKSPLGKGPQERLLAAQLQAVGVEVIVVPWTVDLDAGMLGTWIPLTGASVAYRIEAAPRGSFDIERRYLVVPAGTAEA